MILLKDKIIKIHEQAIEETGGIQGIIDEGMLESALAAPFITFDGKDLYPTIIEKAARLGYGLVCNHAFVDGNKRTGAYAMLLFLNLNEVYLNYSQDDLSDVFVKIASNLASYEDLLNWIINHLS